jgi:hypothetical protein
VGTPWADAALATRHHGSVMITDPTAPGGVIEAKLISGIDDHSRYSVIAKVVPRATARAVCTAFLAAVVEYGVPDEVALLGGLAR